METGRRNSRSGNVGGFASQSPSLPEASAPPRTVHDCLVHLGLSDWRETAGDRLLEWPPDVFAATAYVLRESGAYVQLVHPGGTPLQDWRSRVERAGVEWRDRAPRYPRYVRDLFAAFRKLGETTLASLRSNSNCHEVVELCCIADHACRTIGLPDRRWVDLRKDVLRADYRFRAWLGHLQTRENPTGGSAPPASPASTFARHIHPSRAIVLPKMRTPQSGVTVRSLSHHAALITGSDIVPHWNVVEPPMPGRPPRAPYNLLVVPYPYDVRPAQFSAYAPPASLRDKCPEVLRFFSFDHGEVPDTFETDIGKLIKSAERDVGPVHGLVFPEMAMRSLDFETRVLKGLLRDDMPGSLEFIVCGAYDLPTPDQLGSNFAIVARRDGTKPKGQRVWTLRQHKHHRWILDEGQIRNYGLGSILDPSFRWSEAVSLPGRDLHFFHLDNHCVFSVLICEDLARPDPVGDCLRAVGPNLVVALLLDGPQLPDRWSARYAMALADDPGSSVLTVSSLGMVKLSKPLDRESTKLRAIGLWREPGSGTIPIIMDEGAKGVVLSLTQRPNQEFTLDGRGDETNAGCLRLGGIRSVG